MSSRKFKTFDTDDFKLDKKNGKCDSEKKAVSQVKKQHKVELQTLYLNEECMKEITKTLSSIHGQGFVLKDRSSYTDKGVNLRRHYWVDHGNLIIQEVVKTKKKNESGINQDLVNSFALDKLQSYGFYKSHCSEALKYTDGDVGTALEFLASRYFHLPFAVPSRLSTQMKDIADLNTTVNILEEEEIQKLDEVRREEKDALMSIYDNSFEEKLENRVWILHLKLDYLLDMFKEKAVKKIHNSDVDEDLLKYHKKATPVECCKFYLKGQCKYSYNCRFSHERPVPRIEQEEEKHDYEFCLELRFPEGSRYPFEPGYLFLTTNAPYIQPQTMLQLTNRLLQEAKSSAKLETPCMYNAAQLLLDNEEEIINIALGQYEIFLDSNSLLVPTDSSNEQESEDNASENFEDISEDTSFNSRKEMTLDQRISEDVILARRFHEKRSSMKYMNILQERKNLPIFNNLEDIVDAVKKNQVIVISGETGCGKSTQLPQFLLDDWLFHFCAKNKKHVEIICTQPRRISAIGVAERVAEERVEKIGNMVGYQIRLESKTSSSTRLTFCTTGILLRKLENDPNLAHVTHIIVDEVHERSVESDFLLLILKDLMAVRPDLKVILMSATLNANLFSGYFAGAPTLEIPGRTFPVEQYFLEDILDCCNYVLEENSQYARSIKKKDSDFDSLSVELATANIESEATYSNPKTSDENLNLCQLYRRYQYHDKLTTKTLYLMDPEKINNELIEHVLLWIVDGRHKHPREGSILVFLPGMAEIQSLHEQLSNHPRFSPREGRFILIPLHSSLSSEEQAAVFRKPKRGVRKIVLSTNIAETSVTIDDCVFVVDTGKMKEKRFDTNKNMESLDTVWVSRANAQQRKGRAGRVMPGVCIHLYTKFRYEYQFSSQPVPELHRVPLEQLLLRIKILQMFAEKDVHSVLARMLEPPSRESIDSALERLKNVGALTINKELTPLGCHLAALPVDVRIGKLMLFGAIFCCVDSALTIAACLNFRSPFVSPFAKRENADARKKEYMTGNSDHLTMLKAYKCWHKEFQKSKYGAKVYAEEHYLSNKVLMTLGEIKQQFLELLSSIGFVPTKIHFKKSNVDNVLASTGSELNSNGENIKLLLAIMCAALYPNVAKVLTPEKLYYASANGAFPMEHKADELKFKTQSGGYVHIHPSSVLFSVKHFPSPYLVFQERVRTSKEFIRDCSMVPMLPFILFSGCSLQVELHHREFAISLGDGWIVFAVQSQRVAELLQMIREELIKLLEEKIGNPKMNLMTDSRGRNVIQTIVHIVTKG